MVAVGDKANRKFQHIVKALLDWGTAKGHALKTADVWRNVCQEAVLCGCRVSLCLANIEALTAFALGCLFRDYLYRQQPWD